MCLIAVQVWRIMCLHNAGGAFLAWSAAVEGMGPAFVLIQNYLRSGAKLGKHDSLKLTKQGVGMPFPLFWRCSYVQLAYATSNCARLGVINSDGRQSQMTNLCASWVRSSQALAGEHGWKYSGRLTRYPGFGQGPSVSSSVQLPPSNEAQRHMPTRGSRYLEGYLVYSVHSLSFEL